MVRIRHPNRFKANRDSYCANFPLFANKLEACVSQFTF
jgi:hypothetical protein